MVCDPMFSVMTLINVVARPRHATLQQYNCSCNAGSIWHAHTVATLTAQDGPRMLRACILTRLWPRLRLSTVPLHLWPLLHNLPLPLTCRPLCPQSAAADALAEISKEKLINESDATDLILPLALKYVRAEKSDDEDAPWLHLLLCTLPLLSADTLRTQILKLALSKGEVNETVPARVKCSRLLGGLAAQLVRANPYPYRLFTFSSCCAFVSVREAMSCIAPLQRFRPLGCA